MVLSFFALPKYRSHVAFVNWYVLWHHHKFVRFVWKEKTGWWKEVSILKLLIWTSLLKQIKAFLSLCDTVATLQKWLTVTFHLMCAIVHAHASTCTTILIHVKNRMYHFCLWHLFYCLGQWNKENKTRNKSIKFNGWLPFL